MGFTFGTYKLIFQKLMHFVTYKLCGAVCVKICYLTISSEKNVQCLDSLNVVSQYLLNN